MLLVPEPEDHLIVRVVVRRPLQLDGLDALATQGRWDLSGSGYVEEILILARG